MHCEADSLGTTTLTLTEIILEAEACTLNYFGKLANTFFTLQLDQLTCLKKAQSQVDWITTQKVCGEIGWKDLRVTVLPRKAQVSYGIKEKIDYYLEVKGSLRYII